MSLLDYLLRVEAVYIHHSQKIKNKTTAFEEMMAKKSFYSTSKSHNMKNLINAYQHLVSYI